MLGISAYNQAQQGYYVSAAPSATETREPDQAKPNDSSRVNSDGGDRVELSPFGRSAAKQANNGSDAEGDSRPPGNERNLSSEELQQLRELKSRDREVRAHEQAHLSVAGQYAAGGASFTYKQGPDGARYAVGGEVPIDISAESTPEATILKMAIVRRAALAPANPSAADRQIAAQASMKSAQARQELAQEQQAENGTLQEATSADSASPERVPGAPENLAPQPPPGETAIRSMAIQAYQRIGALA